MTAAVNDGYDYVYDSQSTEQTATCCLGQMFFRGKRRRLTAANSDYYVKAKLDDDDDDDDTTVSGRLASSTERTLAAAGQGVVNLNSKYQGGGGSSEDNSHRLAAASTGAGADSGSTCPPPPSYTATARDDDGRSRQASRKQRQRRTVSAGRLAKEHEMLQNMWLESHGRRQQAADEVAGQRSTACRRSSSVGSSGRTVYVVDRTRRTTYRRGRLLGKVMSYTVSPAGLSRCVNAVKSLNTLHFHSLQAVMTC